MIKHLAQSKSETEVHTHSKHGHSHADNHSQVSSKHKSHDKKKAEVKVAPKAPAVSATDGIINNNSKKVFPRVGKSDRDGQILEDGKVETFVKKNISP